MFADLSTVPDIPLFMGLWTNDLPSDFYKKCQTNIFRAVYRLILTTETKKKTYSGFSVLTQTKSRSLQISGCVREFSIVPISIFSVFGNLRSHSRFSDLFISMISGNSGER